MNPSSVEFRNMLWYPPVIRSGRLRRKMMKKLATFAAAWVILALLFSPSSTYAQDEPEAAQQDEQPVDEEGALDDETDVESDEVEEEPTVDEEPLPEPEPEPVETNCTNQLDDDGDGDMDCDDYDCLDHESCYEEEDYSAEEEDAPTLDLNDEDEEEEDLIDVPEEEEDDDWNDRPVDMFELHGYLRLRGDIFHQLHMARVRGGDNYDVREADGEPNPYHPRPNGDDVVECDGGTCRNNTFAGANMRFRLEPIINLGEHIRILSQIDLLDNMVLGSTPEGSYMDAAGLGYQSAWVPLRFFAGNQAPLSVRNSLSDAIAVRRVWAEVTTPFGQLQFGRMGSHWGLGMLANSGNELDDDYGDTVDRIMLATRLWGILLVPGVEFVNSGAQTQMWGDEQGQPLDAGQLDDITQYFLVIARKLPREEQQERMRRGELVLNAGLYFTFRNQVLSQETIDASGEGTDFLLRNAWAVTPDVWFQLYYRGFHLEFEFAYIGGTVQNSSTDPDDPSNLGRDLRQFGGVVRADYTALDDQLNVGLEFGYASGDAEIEGLTPRQYGSLQQSPGYSGSTTDSLFRFDPDFNVDLILFEQILGQVAGAYYFRPWVSYEFIRNTLGVRADVIYSLASESLQTVGNNPNLGVELNAAIWFRGRPPFNFTAMLQYGVLFPLAGFKDPFYEFFNGLEYPQTVQVQMAVHY